MKDQFISVLAKLPVPIVTKKEEPFKIGKAIKYREGSDITIISTRIMLDESLKKQQVSGKARCKRRTFHIHTIKPIDKEAIIASAAKTKHVITVEEHSIIGGLGSAVVEEEGGVLSENQRAKLRRIGTNDRFGVFWKNG